MASQGAPNPWPLRIWAIVSVSWIAFIAWRTFAGWPAIPLDMGGADPSTDAAYQAAQLQHVAKALGLGLGGPALAMIVLKAASQLARR